MFAPLPLTIPLLIFAIIGLYGNIKFIVINRKEDNLHKRLLLFLVVLQTPLCLCIFVDVIRDFCGIPLTRQSCLRFVGAIYATFVVAMSVLYCCMGVEMIVLVAKPLLFSRLKVWWFHIPVYSVTLAHFYPIYKSWISTEDHSVTICFSPMAIDPNERLFGKWLLMASSILMFIEDVIFLVFLIVKKSILQDSFKSRLLIPSFIIVNVHLFFWLISTLFNMYSVEISKGTGISLMNLMNSTELTSVITFSQTYYAYFFANAENRRAFCKRGPIALFRSAPEPSENQIHPSNATNSFVSSRLSLRY